MKKVARTNVDGYEVVALLAMDHSSWDVHVFPIGVLENFLHGDAIVCCDRYTFLLLMHLAPLAI
jgi:hypothetical protein